MTLDGDAAVRRQEIRIVVHALAGENDPAVESGGIAAEMPLADHDRMVAGRLEHLRHGGLAAVEHIENGRAVGVGIFPRQDHGAAQVRTRQAALIWRGDMRADT